MTELEKIADKNSWNKQISTHSGAFLQSWQWGDILLSEGKQVERLAISENNEKLYAQVVYANLPFGWKYAFCPKGPIGKISDQSMIILKEYLAKQGVIFLRLEPKEKNDWLNLAKSVDINPRATLILDLQKSEEDILNGMRPKTRYNIRLAQKKNLQIKEDKNLPIFLELMKKTGSRDNFRLHETKHYEAILHSEFSQQFTVYSGEMPIATAVFVGFGKTFTYLFGASDHEYRALMASYLLQWEAIKTGQKAGCKFYDFFGVAPKINDGLEYEFDEKHQYGGVSRFKYGFGGQYVEAPGTFDLVINNFKYNLYSFLRKLRRLI